MHIVRGFLLSGISRWLASSGLTGATISIRTCLVIVLLLLLSRLDVKRELARRRRRSLTVAQLESDADQRAWILLSGNNAIIPLT